MRTQLIDDEKAFWGFCPRRFIALCLMSNETHGQLPHFLRGAAHLQTLGAHIFNVPSCTSRRVTGFNCVSMTDSPAPRTRVLAEIVCLRISVLIRLSKPEGYSQQRLGGRGFRQGSFTINLLRAFVTTSRYSTCSMDLTVCSGKQATSYKSSAILLKHDSKPVLLRAVT